MLPIWTAANEAVTSGEVAPLPPKLRNLGLHVSTRLNILPCVVKRLNSNTNLLYEKAKEHDLEYVFTEEKSGYTFRVDNNLIYPLLADIDALLFELNSACELMKSLFALLRSHVDQPIPKKQLGRTIKDVLKQCGQNADWFKMLGKHRNFFMHEGAPYIAVDLSNEPAKLDLLIMKENVTAFADPDRFVSLSEINHIVHGFIAAKQCFQDYLVGLFTDLLIAQTTACCCSDTEGTSGYS